LPIGFECESRSGHPIVEAFVEHHDLSLPLLARQRCELIEAVHHHDLGRNTLRRSGSVDRCQRCDDNRGDGHCHGPGSHAGHFALDHLPANSPELNPIERAWELSSPMPAQSILRASG
jgi:hypothetical protein